MTTPIAIIPRPAHLEQRPGEFTLTSRTVVAIDLAQAGVDQYLAETLERVTGHRPKTVFVTDPQPGRHTILVSIRAGRAPQLGDEGYELSATPDAVSILAATPHGAFHGIQTFLQLLPAEVFSPVALRGVDWKLPCIHITDQPRFAWRGMHLDVCRHFFTVANVKRYLDFLALHKLNIFHLHLTEDQGWRIAIKQYPKLTEIGSHRKESQKAPDDERGDGKPHGGFYTQDEIREIVAYAASRQITVVPEIEMPGHSLAALAAYPELSCTGGPFAVRTKWGVEPDVYCAGNDQVFAFLEDVLTEVLGLFPSQFIHIGGDECPKDRWQQCPKCQARIQAEGLKDEHELQSYFIRRIERFLNAHGRRLIGWDEILEGGLAPQATVMSWRGTEGGLAAATAGHDAVMTPYKNCYFNLRQGSDLAAEPSGFSDFLPLENVYAYEPVPATLPAEQHHHILGVQGCLWTEFIPIWPIAEYMALPRMSALAEVGWSSVANRQYADFRRRLPNHLQRLDQLGASYRHLDASATRPSADDGRAGTGAASSRDDAGTRHETG